MSTHLFLDQFMAAQDRPTEIMIFASYVTIAYTTLYGTLYGCNILPFTFRSITLKSLAVPCQPRITQGVDYI